MDLMHCALYWSEAQMSGCWKNNPNKWTETFKTIYNNSNDDNIGGNKSSNRPPFLLKL